MRRLLTLLLFLLSSSLCIAQTPNYVEGLEQFQTHYNNKDATSAFNLFSETMQASIGVKKLEGMFKEFNTNYGAFKDIKYVEREDLVEEYTATFEKGQLRTLIIVNEDNKIAGLSFKNPDKNRPAKFYRNSTELQLPFKGEWFTFWGGDNKRQNYHVVNKAQQGAFDFMVLDAKDQTYTRSGTRNEDYYAFGKPLYAVCDAEVYDTTTGVPDNRPTIMNPAQPLGNSIILKTANNEYILYAHFELGTIKVKKGDKVKQGQYLGNCGNSGNSSQAHLHLHIQDGPNLMSDIGVACFFEELMVNGKLEKNYSPVKGDRISIIKD